MQRLGLRFGRLRQSGGSQIGGAWRLEQGFGELFNHKALTGCQKGKAL
jgi:hypothetical protein